MSRKFNILITGGAGFIGSALCRFLFKTNNYNLIILDKLTYASNLKSLESILNEHSVTFIKGSIGNNELTQNIFKKYLPDYVFNLAAETHVDNSIKNPALFTKTNVLETQNFLDETLKYFITLPKLKKNKFKFLHVSTDEVFGDIRKDEKPVLENAPYKPSSPYSASKASSDHLVNSYYRTFGLPTLITNCSNNYGPYQHHEKFIPVIINSLFRGIKIPLYGDGQQIREWLFVDDHCDALHRIIENGTIGQSYNIGSRNELTNYNLIELIINEFYKQALIKSNVTKEYINFITDRPGHDRRYAINSDKLVNNLKWKPKTTIFDGIKETISHYNTNKI